MGQATDKVSPETPFTFHVLRLRPFELWAANCWPCGCVTNIIAGGADPDGDRGANTLEYGTGTDPKQFNINAWSEFSFVSTNGHACSALMFNQSKTVLNATCEVVATSNLTALDGRQLTNVHHLQEPDRIERVTMRDDVLVANATHRFYAMRGRAGLTWFHWRERGDRKPPGADQGRAEIGSQPCN